MRQGTAAPAALERAAGGTPRGVTAPGAAIDARSGHVERAVRVKARASTPSPAVASVDRQVEELQRTFGVRWEW
ncbi:MAG: hypothetical protein H6Q86_4984 [candidate division NC10 bacterium]|nr:hypothetical protein [candidate division NC10 bacterium]